MRDFSARAFVITGLLIAFVSCQAKTDVEPHLFRVERGQSAQKIAHALADQGFIQSPWSVLVWVKLQPRHHKSIHPGVYPLYPGMSGYSILNVLRQGPPSARVTFPEGWTAPQMAALLEAHNVVPAAVFLQKVTQEKLEGFLFPDTYIFDQGSDVDTVVNALRRRFAQKRPADWAARQKALHLSEFQLVTLASIVEREARVPQERPLIAGVFMNRLHKHMRLQSCATVEYALGKWKPRLRYYDLKINSPYNTYQHSGLPPGPIGNPGAAALDAAAHPAQTPMLFFVAAGDGTHHFSQTYNDHMKFQEH